MVSVEEKGRTRSDQVRSKETSASKPLMTCRKVQRCRQNRVSLVNLGTMEFEPKSTVEIDPQLEVSGVTRRVTRDWPIVLMVLH